jgi:hypothetical protein
MNLLSGLDSGDEPPPVPAHMRPRTATATAVPGPTIGASIAARPTHHTRNMVIALVGLGVAATVVTLAVIMKDDEVAPKAAATPTVEPLPKTNGTLKFVIDPTGATIKVDAEPPQTGSPWQIQLPAGLHQVEINHPGYKSWLTSIELSHGETQTLRVVLEKIAGGETAASTATLIVDPSIPGMEVVLDGNVLEQKTPLKMEVEPGPHVVALRQDGTEVWTEDFKAVANATHEFDPSMSDDKKRERKHRRERTAVASTTPQPERQDWVYSPAKPAPTTTPSTTTPSTAPSPSTTPKTTPSTTTAPSTSTTTTTATTTPKTNNAAATTPGTTATTATTAPKTERTTPTTTTTTTPTPAPKTTTTTPAPSTGPVTIPPNKAKRTSGSVPSLKGSSSYASEKIPANISAKVCIDTGGGVSSASVLTKLPEEAKAILTKAIKTWRYAPYKEGGTAVSACFVASFRSN